MNMKKYDNKIVTIFTNRRIVYFILGKYEPAMASDSLKTITQIVDSFEEINMNQRCH